MGLDYGGKIQKVWCLSISLKQFILFSWSSLFLALIHYQPQWLCLMTCPSAWTKHFLSGTKKFCPGQKIFCPGQKKFVQDKIFCSRIKSSFLLVEIQFRSCPKFFVLDKIFFVPDKMILVLDKITFVPDKTFFSQTKNFVLS